MIYLLDTNALSDLMREEPAIKRRLAQLAPADRVITCTVAWGEILFGIQRLTPRSRRRLDIEAKATELARVIPSEAIPPDAAAHYARIKDERFRAGRPLDENDLWIAATALTISATVVTRDTDLVSTQGLSVENWMS